MQSIFPNNAVTTDVSGDSAVATGSGVGLLEQRKRKTILFITNTGEYGGAEKHLLELVRRLIASDVQLSILCLDKDLYTKHLTQDQVAQINIVRRTRKLRSFGDWYRVFADTRPDVVVFVRAWLWCYRWYVPIAAWLAGIPRRISIVHLTPPPVPVKLEGRPGIGRTPHLLTLRVSAHFQSAIVCVSNTIRDALVRDYRFPANKTITIYNGISSPEFGECENRGLALRTRLGFNPQEMVLVCIARLNEQKRIDILLLALARLLRDGVHCKCVIVGDGPLREELSAQALALGLTGHVLFEGFREDVKPYLQAGTVFVLTSDREGFPLAILEAMASGLPCVATKVGGNAEAVTHGVHGLLVRPGCVEEVAAAISHLLTHPHERAEMSRMARKRVREQFDIESRMAEIKSVILG